MCESLILPDAKIAIKYILRPEVSGTYNQQ